MRRPLASFVLLLCASCAAPAPAPLPPAPPDPKTLMPALEQRIYELVDEQRRLLAPRLAPLALDSELVGVAREKSADMAEHNYAAHRAPNGETAANLIMEKDAQFQGVLGEEIAAQPFVPGYPIDVDVLAHRIVGLWLASPPHRDTLADSGYTRIGVGAAATANTIYVTALFAGDFTLPARGQRKPAR